MRRILLFLFLAVPVYSCNQTAATGYQNLDNKTFAEKMKDTGVVVLDVRTQDEYDHGHIHSAMQLDFYNPNFKSSLDTLNKNKTYLVYCAAGGRSSKTCKMLKERGCDKVYNLEHGFNKWDGEKEQ